MDKSENGQPEGLFEQIDARPAALQILRAHLRPLRKRLLRQRVRLVSDVHDARVEIRRARAALGLCLPLLEQKRAQQLDRRLREIGRLLGPVRDLDVVMERSLGWGLERRGESLVEFLYRVARARHELVVETERQLEAHFPAEQVRASRRLLGKGVVSGEAWRRSLEIEIRSALLSLAVPLASIELAAGQDVPAPPVLEQWHQRRKVCRRLRYQLEMLGADLHLRPAIDFLRGAQVRFGAVQDSAFIQGRIRDDLSQMMSRRLQRDLIEREQCVLGEALAEAKAWWSGPAGWERSAEAIIAALSLQDEPEDSLGA